MKCGTLIAGILASLSIECNSVKQNQSIFREQSDAFLILKEMNLADFKEEEKTVIYQALSFVGSKYDLPQILFLKKQISLEDLTVISQTNAFKAGESLGLVKDNTPLFPQSFPIQNYENHRIIRLQDEKVYKLLEDIVSQDNRTNFNIIYSPAMIAMTIHEMMHAYFDMLPDNTKTKVFDEFVKIDQETKGLYLGHCSVFSQINGLYDVELIPPEYKLNLVSEQFAEIGTYQVLELHYRDFDPYFQSKCKIFDAEMKVFREKEEQLVSGINEEEL